MLTSDWFLSVVTSEGVYGKALVGFTHTVFLPFVNQIEVTAGKFTLHPINDLQGQGGVPFDQLLPAS